MGMHPGSKTVIGVSIEEWVAGQGCSSSLLYLHKEAWTDEDTEHMRFVQDELGYFSQPLTTAVHEDEYPVSGSTRQVTTLVDGEQFGPVRPGHRIGRNDTCPCGSGKKFKRCHGR